MTSPALRSMGVVLCWAVVSTGSSFVGGASNAGGEEAQELVMTMQHFNDALGVW